MWGGGEDGKGDKRIEMVNINSSVIKLEFCEENILQLKLLFTKFRRITENQYEH